MIATQETMSNTFKKCNEKYFNNNLPTPLFKTFNKINTIARFEYYKNKKGSKKPINGQTIFMSNCFIYPKKDFIDTMVHEMIHYYISWNKIKDNGSHGKVFMKIANEMNNKYSLNITIKKDASLYRLTKNAPKFIENKKSSISSLWLHRLAKPISHIISTLSLVKII